MFEVVLVLIFLNKDNSASGKNVTIANTSSTSPLAVGIQPIAIIDHTSPVSAPDIIPAEKFDSVPLQQQLDTRPCYYRVY